jgi:dTDP-4-dehydrorhamnose reductase|tara:strand:- start:532 stop:1434 length:903 start_codon:yes stop_codon:yes gene_type:complete
MKILVVGKNSQLGKELQNYSDNHTSNNKFIFLDSKSMNICDEISIKNILFRYKPNIVINFSAYTNVEASESNIDVCYETNAIGPMYLAKICKEINSYLIHISTDYVFGENSKGPFSNISSTGPVNIYGKSKLEGENNVLKYNDKSIIIRTASVFSSYNNNFVKNISKKILLGETIKVINDQNISLTYAGDLSYFIFNLINSHKFNNIIDNLLSKIIHYTNENFTSWFEVASYIAHDLKVYNKNKILPISSFDWESKVIRPIDSRLILDYDLFSLLNVKTYDWKNRVSKVLEQLNYKEENL